MTPPKKKQQQTTKHTLYNVYIHIMYTNILKQEEEQINEKKLP